MPALNSREFEIINNRTMTQKDRPRDDTRTVLLWKK